MARKRKESLEGQVTIWLTPEEIFQLESICTIRMADSLAQICRGFILTGMQRETKDILASVALSYKVAERDQETDPSSIGRARDACGPVCNPDWTSTTAPTQDAFRLKRNPKLPFQGEPFPDELDPPELNDKGLRGGEADEESLQKPKHVSLPDEYATCPHGTRNADLDSPHEPTSKDMTAAGYIYWTDKQGTIGANMQPAYLERFTVPSADRGHEVKGHEVDQYANGSTRLTTNTELLKGEEDEA